MTKPDLNTPEGVDAYRLELRGIVRPWRIASLVLIVLGAAAVMTRVWVEGWPDAVVSGGYIALGLGWVLMIVAVFQRTRYHRRRMAESE